MHHLGAVGPTVLRYRRIQVETDLGNHGRVVAAALTDVGVVADTRLGVVGVIAQATLDDVAVVAVAGLFSNSFVMRAALDNTGMQAIRIAPPRPGLADGGIILVAATLDDRGVRVGDIPLIDHAVVVLAAIGDAGRRARAFILIDVCIPFVSRLGNEGVDIAAVVLLDDRVVALAAVVDGSQGIRGWGLSDVRIAPVPTCSTTALLSERNCLMPICDPLASHWLAKASLRLRD